MRRLPDGELTESTEEYLNAWQDLGRTIEKATGYTLYGFDPTMSFSDGNSHVQLPVEFVMRLSNALKGK